MIFREAILSDIPQLQHIRGAVKENILSDPGLVLYDDYVTYLSQRGKGWLCEKDSVITGFAIADLDGDNIWVLFVLPEYEGKGIAQGLQKLMLDWCFDQGKARVWLSTSPGTRADNFYRKTGWIETGTYGRYEIRFEMSKEQWQVANRH